jgi:hypothetical protein
MKTPSTEKLMLFYFETKNERFYPVPLIIGFEETMLLRDWELRNGCIGVIIDKNILEKSIIVKDGIKGFKATGLCVKDLFEASRPEILFTTENFTALRLEGKKVIDIKEEVLRGLGF